MFTVGDRVRARFDEPRRKGNKMPDGVVIAINGKFITVRHDSHPTKFIPSQRFDYLEEELVHLNPLLRLAFETQ